MDKSMRERLARAICCERKCTRDLCGWQHFVKAVDAILATLREPSEEMIRAGCVDLTGSPPWDEKATEGWAIGPDGAKKCYAAMIAAVKNNDIA